MVNKKSKVSIWRRNMTLRQLLVTGGGFVGVLALIALTSALLWPDTYRPTTLDPKLRDQRLGESKQLLNSLHIDAPVVYERAADEGCKDLSSKVVRGRRISCRVVAYKIYTSAKEPIDSFTDMDSTLVESGFSRLENDVDAMKSGFRRVGPLEYTGSNGFTVSTIWYQGRFNRSSEITEFIKQGEIREASDGQYYFGIISSVEYYHCGINCDKSVLEQQNNPR